MSMGANWFWAFLGGAMVVGGSINYGPWVGAMAGGFFLLYLAGLIAIGIHTDRIVTAIKSQARDRDR